MLQMLFNDKKVGPRYSDYAREVGFGFMTRRSAKGEGGKLKYFILACARYGKTISAVKNTLQPVLQIRMQSQDNCITLSRWEDQIDYSCA